MVRERKEPRPSHYGVPMGGALSTLCGHGSKPGPNRVHSTRLVQHLVASPAVTRWIGL